MPNWKKVITSGSAAELSSVYAPSITGSLLGTASYAITAETASLSNASTLTQILVLNQAGFTIPKGTVVRITGSNNASDIPRITTASYESDGVSANTLGITKQQIINGSQGYVVTEGVLTGIDTSNFESGQLLYLGTTGSIIGTVPIAPLHGVRLGEVIRQQSNAGSIYVRIDNGAELGELHDVLDTTTTSTYGDLLVKSGSVWINSKQLTGSYGLTGSLIVTGSSNTDLVRITQTGTGNAFVVEDDTNPDSTPFVINPAGNVGIGTTSPSQQLHISSSDARVRLQSSATNIWDLVSNNGGGGAQNDFVIQSIGTRGAIYLGAYATNNVTWISSLGALTVSSSGNSSFTGTGNVGIGTTSPNAKLVVVSPASSSYNENIATFRVSDGGNSALSISNAVSTDNVFVPSITGLQDSSSNQSAIYIGGYIQPIQDSGSTPVTVFRSANADLTPTTTRPLFDFRNWTTSVMRIDAAGNVGIGKTTPTAKLDVTGSAFFTGSVAIKSFSTASTGNTDDVNIAFRVNDSTGKPLFAIRNNGTAGVLPPTGFGGLFLNDDVSFTVNGKTTDSTTRAFRVHDGNTNPALQVRNDRRVTIGSDTFDDSALSIYRPAGTTYALTTDGRVGINTSSPTLATLQVNGNVYADSYTGSFFGTSSYSGNSLSASFAQNSATASYLNTLNQDLIFNGNLTLNGTASISFLNVTYESASVIYSSGSNQLGDATTDTQTLIGTTVLSGSLQVTGSSEITGSLNVNGPIDTTNRVSAGVFMHPKTITDNITILQDYNAILISPVAISGNITVESNADLFIIN